MGLFIAVIGLALFCAGFVWFLHQRSSGGDTSGIGGGPIIDRDADDDNQRFV